MPSLMNGLSSMGAGIASFAGTAGLEQQKATLAQQGMTLADQLATAREQNVTQPFEKSQAQQAQAATLSLEQGRELSEQGIARTQAGATTGAASIAAGAELEAEMIRQTHPARIPGEGCLRRSAQAARHLAAEHQAPRRSPGLGWSGAWSIRHHHNVAAIRRERRYFFRFRSVTIGKPDGQPTCATCPRAPGVRFGGRWAHGYRAGRQCRSRLQATQNSRAKRAAEVETRFQVGVEER